MAQTQTTTCHDLVVMAASGEQVTSCATLDIALQQYPQLKAANPGVPIALRRRVVSDTVLAIYNVAGVPDPPAPAQPQIRVAPVAVPGYTRLEPS